MFSAHYRHGSICAETCTSSRGGAPLLPGRRPALPARTWRVSAGRGGLSSNSWAIPDELLQSQFRTREDAAGKNLTVYTVRISTSLQRGAAINEPLAGINLCLVARSGKVGLLHRVSPVNDPDANSALLRHICSIVDGSTGANCEAATSRPSLPPGKPAAVRPRFQEGSVDEVCFLGPEMGPLAALMVAPEGGSWVLDEVDVSSSLTNHTDRFVCRSRLGGRSGEPAAYLQPVPPGAVVYGSGDGAVVLSKEQAAALYVAGMGGYSELKQRLLLTTALLTAGGSGVAAMANGWEAALPFGIGGLAGIGYQLLLQRGVDSLPVNAYGKASSAASGQPPSVPPALSGPERFLSSSTTRLAIITTAALLLLQMHHPQLAGENLTAPVASFSDAAAWQALQPVNAWQLLVGCLGFLMYKVAILGVALTPQPISETSSAKQYEKNA